MRFDENVQWSEGLFLQQHHMQVMQRFQEQKLRKERYFHTPFPYGLIDFELDNDALNNYRIVLKQISAIMPEGEELSMPGNTIISPLDVTEEIQKHVTSFTVCLALPIWSEYDGNLAEEGDSASRRQYISHETMVRDENSGDNEIAMIRQRFNARLTTDQRDNNDMELLPILKLTPKYYDTAEAALEIDRSYIAPFMMLSSDCPLLDMTIELNIQIANRKNKLLYDLAAANFTVDAMSGSVLFSVLQLQTLSNYEGRLSSLLHSNRIAPFDLYMELKSLLAELSALQPLREFGVTEEYNHLNYAPQFTKLFTDIRSLIMAEGVSSYIKLPFAKTDGKEYSSLSIKDSQLNDADEFYLALTCAGDPRKIVNAVENGDNFKLVNPSSASMRIRGVKLVEMRYPPRFLPAIPDTIWFKLNKDESPRIWKDICNEHGMALDWAEEIFPKLEATLFVTVLNQGARQ